jgi:hypothetical protein
VKNTRLSGHALRHEGKPFRRGGRTGNDWVRHYGNDRQGFGLCECGATSPELATDAARRRWHVNHKAEVRQAAGE